MKSMKAQRTNQKSERVVLWFMAASMPGRHRADLKHTAIRARSGL